MKQVSNLALKAMCIHARGLIDKIYLHWTAGNYNQMFDDYHININGNGDVYVSGNDFTVYREHTWHRNSRAVGISLCCAFGAELGNGGLATGKYPPTREQIEAMASIIAILCTGLHLEINEDTVMTHAEVAKIDGYGVYSGDPLTKWDLYKLKDIDGMIYNGGDILRGKAQWYFEQGV